MRYYDTQCLPEPSLSVRDRLKVEKPTGDKDRVDMSESVEAEDSKSAFWVLTLVGFMLILVFPLFVFTGISLYESALEWGAVNAWVPFTIFTVAGLVCYFLGCWSIVMAHKHRRSVAKPERD